MATLTIPDEYLDALASILSLPEEAFKELQLALESVPRSISTSVLPEEASAKIQAIPETEVEDIIQALMSLSFLRDRAGVDTEEFVEDVVDAAEEQEIVEPELFDEKRELFKPRLTSLLDSTALSIAAKARSILVDHEHDLCSARLLTDIRPVFRSDSETDPTGAVLVHTLRISYHHNNRIKEFYVAMDTQDLDWLGTLIEQAKNKAESLKSLISSTKLSYIDVD